MASLASSRTDPPSSGYAPHPLRYATYEGGLHNLDVSRTSDVNITPQQTQSARRPPPTAMQQVPGMAHGRSAFTDVSKKKGSGMTSLHPARAPASSLEPTRLDFTPDSSAHSAHVSFDGGLAAGQKDTMI